jgi:hypothetical protein
MAHPEEYVKWYKQLNWKCTVYWDDEFEEFCGKIGN